MVQTTTAIYEQGTLRLLEPLVLPEHARVRVQVETVEPLSPAEELERAREALRQAGLLVPVPDSVREQARTVPASERERIAQILAKAGSLSDLIISERESR